MPGFDPIDGAFSDLANRTLLLSASAGTGKTWMITHLATRWLLADDANDPAALLMVTFATRAARELKARLRSRMVEVDRILDGDLAPTDAWTARCIDDSRTPAEERARLRRRLARVLTRLDEVNARTLHSFAAMVGDRSSGTTTSGDTLWERAVNETLTRAALMERERLGMLVFDPDRPAEQRDLTIRELRARLLKTARGAAGLGGLGVSGTISKASFFEREDDGEFVHSQVRMFEDLVVSSERRVADLMHLEAQVTFDSMVVDAYRDAVEGSATTASLQHSFKLVLIDEFQDTDAAQWAIFEEAFLGKVPVILVGDPKQAIYTFRGGDVVIFQELLGAARTGSDALLVHELSRNFRSAPGLLANLNALFLVAEDDELATWFETSLAEGAKGLARRWSYASQLLTADQLMSPIPYEPVIVGAAAEGGRMVIRDLTSSVPLMRRSDAAVRPTSLPYDFKAPTGRKASEVRDELVEDMAAVVAEYLSVGWSPESIAVLVRSNRLADQIHRALTKAGIPTVTAKTDSVFSSTAALHLRCLLWALVEPSNPRRGGFLGSTWFSAVDLEELPSLTRTLETYGPGALARRVLDTRTTSVILGAEDPERSWTDLDQLFELLGSEFGTGVTPAVALRWLEEKVASKAEDEESRDAAARRVEGDGASVTVMTLHGAKGLEFDVVLVPEVEQSPGGKEYHQLDGVLSTAGGRRFDVDRLVAKSVNDESAAAIDEQRQKSDEAARLIYVGLTRAKQELVAWITDLDRHEYGDNEGANISKTSLWRLLVESLLCATDEDLERIAARSAAAEAPFDPQIEIRSARLGDLTTAPVERHALSVSTEGVMKRPFIDEAQRRWSYSALHLHGTTAPQATAFDDEHGASVDGGVAAEDVGDEVAAKRRGRELFGGHAGAVVGTAIHEVFEAAVGTFTSEDVGRLEAEVVASYRRGGIALDAPGPITEQFATVMRHSLGAQFDNLSLDGLTGLGRTRTANEMRFILPLEGSGAKQDRLSALGRIVVEEDPEGPYTGFFLQLAEEPESSARLFQGYLNGSIDLVAQVGSEPRFMVIDYKSNLLKDADSYAPAELVGEMELSGYPLQGLLYAVAVHRYLARRLPDYDPAKHLGGICYYYVRGAALPGAQAGDGLAHWQITSNAVTGVSDLLAGRRDD